MIEPSIEKALAPTRESWKTNVYQSKLFAFITSGWLAVFVIAVLLAVVYVLLKMPPLAPQTEIMTIEPIAPTKQVVKPAIKKEAAKAVNKPVTTEVGIPATPLKPKFIDLSPIDTAPIPPSPPFPPN